MPWHRPSVITAPAKNDPPVWFVGIQTLDQLYLAQRTYLVNVRGADRLAPEAGMTGGVMPVPRSTNADVIRLAGFWSRALAVEAAKNVNGYDTVRRRWAVALSDVDRLTRGADPDAVYPKNHALWRAMSSVAIHVAAAMAALPPIRSWLDGYAALRRRAEEERGWIELDTDAPDRRWPRTTGLDVIVIAAFVDDAYQRTDVAQWPGTALRWDACKKELSRDALHALDDTYRGNRDFWPCLAMLCAHLAYVEAPVPPPAAWHVLLEQMSTRPATRNAPPSKDDPPVWFAGVPSLNKLYLTQRTYLANLRGADRLAPEADMTGGVMPVPRATNADVIRLAEFWTRALDAEKAKNANGYDTVKARWSAARADVDRLARGADPGAVYAKNHALWRAMSSVAIHVAAADEYGLNNADLWKAAVGERILGVSERAKEIASNIAAGVRDVAAETAKGAGKIINEGARGLFGGLGTPLLIGGGVVAAVLLLRGRSGNDSAQGGKS